MHGFTRPARRLIVIATITATVGSNLQIASYIGRRTWQLIRFLYRAPWWVAHILAGLLGALSLGPAAYLVMAGPPRPDSAGALYFTADTCLLALATVAWAVYLLSHMTLWPRTAGARRTS
jgi:hypothetical protein